MRDVLHINGIDVDKFACEAIIIKLEFENLDTAFELTAKSDGERIL